MSGICGIVRLDGAPVDRGALQRMVQAGQHLGPDGTGVWVGAREGLAQLALHTTPDSVLEKQPLVLDSGKLVLVADARVDNRSDLIGTLTTKGLVQRGDISDARLILAAYQAWDEGFASHIIGDFALALWDGEKQRLVCASDPFGIRPLFYFLDEDVFLFASTARQVLAHGAARARLNERAIAHYLTGRPHDFLTEGTFFEGIRRVRPAHVATVDRQGTWRQRRFWDVDRASQSGHDSVEGNAASLLRMLSRSVKCQQRSLKRLVVLTSGGMDSTSIASILAQGCPPEGPGGFALLSFVFGDEHPADERRYIEQVAQRCGAEVHFLDGTRCLPFSHAPSIPAIDDEPPRYWNDPLWHAVFARCAELGASVALWGQGGDCLFTVQDVLFGDLARQGRLLELAREVWAVAPAYRKRLGEAALMESAVALSPLWFLSLWRRVRGGGQPWVNAEFAQPHVGVVNEHRWGFPSYGFHEAHRATRYFAISDWLYPVQAAMRRLASAHGVELRDPYLNRDLVEFAVALPAQHIYHRGVTKRVLRLATAGILPDVVRLRSSETVFGSLLVQGLLQWSSRSRRRDLSDWGIVRRGYVVEGGLADALEAYHRDPSMQKARNLWRPILLEQWLATLGESRASPC